jgi:hypothetical protein
MEQPSSTCHPCRYRMPVRPGESAAATLVGRSNVERSGPGPGRCSPQHSGRPILYCSCLLKDTRMTYARALNVRFSQGFFAIKFH